MIFPCLLVAAGCAAFIYRAFDPKVHASPELARRMRLALGAVVMLLVTIAAYRIPVELSEAIQSAQKRQSLALIDRKRLMDASEIRHARAMISVLGSSDNYMAYLSAIKSYK